jgi:DNA polymerase III alpha subunit (gram-positive type)
MVSEVSVHGHLDQPCGACAEAEHYSREHVTELSMSLHGSKEEEGERVREGKEREKEREREIEREEEIEREGEIEREEEEIEIEGEIERETLRTKYTLHFFQLTVYYARG